MKSKLFAPLLLLLTVVQGCAPCEPTVAEKAAKLLIVGVEGQSLTAENPIIPSVADRGVVGVILFGHNVATYDTCDDPRGQLTQFVADLKALRREPLLISIDQEGGLVNRLKECSGFLPMPSHRVAAEGRDTAALRQIAATIASEVASVGINFNFAPCVDVDVNPDSPAIGHFGRSFSADPNFVATCASIYVEEHHKRGVLTSLKHFPGHGNAESDSHLGLTDITKTWSKDELIPYSELMQSGLCDAVMVSHLYNENIDAEYPATLSEKWLKGVLRDSLGWQGAVVSDDMQMRAITDHYGFEEAVVRGLNAGVDLFIVGGNIRREEYDVVEKFIEIVETAVESGTLSMEKLNASVARVERLFSAIE